MSRSAPVRLSPNDALLAAAYDELRILTPVIEEAPDSDPRLCEWIKSADNFVDILVTRPAETSSGLLAKAAALINVGSEANVPTAQERLAVSLAQDVVWLMTEPYSDCTAKGEAP